MEKELYDRLSKLPADLGLNWLLPITSIQIALATLEAIRAHQCAMYPCRDGESLVFDEAIALVKSYR